MQLEGSLGTGSTPTSTGGGMNVSGNLPGSSAGNANIAGTNATQNPNSAYAAIANSNSLVNSTNNTLAQNSAASDQTSALLKSIQAELQANTPGVALSGQQLNLSALQSQASKNAANTVNPLYTQYLNEYNQGLAANQTAAQQANANNIQAEQNQLGNTLAQNQQAQTFAGQQNAATQGNVNAQAQNYQLNAGNAQTAKTAAISSQLGSGNLSASGYGQQQLWQAENARNIADAQQQGQFQYQRNSSNLSTQDTFAQLAQSSNYAQQGATTSEAATNFNLADYLRQAAASDTAYTQGMEAQRQTALSNTTANNLASSLQSAIQGRGLSGKDLAATESAYNSQLSGGGNNPTAFDISSYLPTANAATV